MKSHGRDAKVADSHGSWSGSMARGFLVAVLSSVSWGIGNTITKYSADKYSTGHGTSAVIDVSLANYIGGCITLLVVSWLINERRKSHEAGPSLTVTPRKNMIIPAFMKACNTYAFVASVALVSAGTAATLENLNVLWTTIFTSIVARKFLHWSWFLSA